MPLVSAAPGTILFVLRGFEVGLAFATTHTAESVWEEIARLINDHDQPGVDELLISVGVPNAHGQVYPSVSLASPPMVGGFVKNINPITNWTMMLQPPNELDAPFVFDYCHQAMGELESRAAKAERDERSLAGRIARFLSFPSEIRRLAGGQSRAGQVATFGIGVFLQGVAVTVVGGLVLAGIIALLIRIF
jgi:hypothetical protein